jgi:uncharacterized protein YjbI with pentapeptide repeats
MRLVNAQPKHTTAFWVVSRPRRGRHHATIIVKAAYRLVPNGLAIANEDKPPVASGDDPAEPGTAPNYASDFVPHKPKADFIAVGAAHAPGGTPVPACRVSIALGGRSKSLVVFGDRRWTWGPLGASPGQPEPFVTLPLGYQRAFGGPGSRDNPVGRGADVRAGQPLPNIERLDCLITQSTQRPDPAGFGPLATSWQPRFGKAGTYDAAWLAERWPWFPADMDWSFFNAAPPDQQFSHLHGDESLEFENLHPEHTNYRSQLPGVRARVFVERTPEAGGSFEEVAAKLDTIWVDVPAEQLVLVWRGTTRVQSPRLRDLAAICATLEPLDAGADIAAHYAAFAELKDSSPGAAEAEAKRAELDRRRKEAESRTDEAMAQVARLQQTAAFMLKATGLDEKRRRARLNSDDPTVALLQGLAAIKEKNAEKGKQLEDRLEALDQMLGEALAKTARDPPWTRDRVIDALATGKTLAGAKLDGLNLASLDFTGADLHDATLKGAALHAARLDRTNLAGADLSNSNLTNTSFAATDLSGANFSDALVGTTTFAQARIDMTVFAKLDLAGADFTGATGNSADFADAVLDDACFVNAALPRSRFTSARAAGADFSGAVLEAADFSGAKAPGIIMEDADLTNLRAGRGADFSDGRFARARGPRSVWQQAILDRADFDRAVLSQAQFAEASLRDAHFDRAHLQTVNFDDAILASARFTNANLLRASFERTDLTQTQVDGCNLYGAGLLDATLEGTTFQGSMIVQTLLAR